jgi:cell division inhibitor SepF
VVTCVVCVVEGTRG